jgi:hypothetical protein
MENDNPFRSLVFPHRRYTPVQRRVVLSVVLSAVIIGVLAVVLSPIWLELLGF